ncbi:hypothetical protein Golomagni_05643 [Golovinomyces magnicellulatus]|nr:hypothetical protein Golomagni_05643 [Golovinomyces magnicellulatus]
MAFSILTSRDPTQDPKLSDILVETMNIGLQQAKQNCERSAFSDQIEKLESIVISPVNSSKKKTCPVILISSI